jgi:enamine deaminase RidA (YjgF/YER057c/UK114 family)
VRLEFLQDPGPCGTAVRVAGFMTAGLMIEVEVIAALNGGSS